MVKTLACIPLAIGIWLIGAWILMLNVGIIHHRWLPILPPIGFGTALIVGALSSIGMLARVLLISAIQATIK